MFAIFVLIFAFCFILSVTRTHFKVQLTFRTAENSTCKPEHSSSGWRVKQLLSLNILTIFELLVKVWLRAQPRLVFMHLFQFLKIAIDVLKAPWSLLSPERSPGLINFSQEGRVSTVWLIHSKEVICWRRSCLHRFGFRRRQITLSSKFWWDSSTSVSKSNFLREDDSASLTLSGLKSL